MADDDPGAEPRRPRRHKTVIRWGVVISVIVGAGVLATVFAGRPAAPQVPRVVVTASPDGGSACAGAPWGVSASRAARTYGSVPPGAASVRLCNTNELGGGVPPDALTSHVAELTDLINGLPRLPSDATCTMELGPHYALLFDYPDDTRSVVGGELDGCRVIVGRRGAQQVIEAYLGRLLEQRRQLPPPVVDVTARCATTYPSSSWLPPAVSATVRAVWCPADNAAEHPILRWTTLRDTIKARVTTSTGADGSEFRGTIRAVAPSGEVTTLWLNGTTLTWNERTASNGSVEMEATLPDADVARLVAG